MGLHPNRCRGRGVAASRVVRYSGLCYSPPLIPAVSWRKLGMEASHRSVWSRGIWGTILVGCGISGAFAAGEFGWLDSLPWSTRAKIAGKSTASTENADEVPGPDVLLLPDVPDQAEPEDVASLPVPAERCLQSAEIGAAAQSVDGKKQIRQFEFRRLRRKGRSRNAQARESRRSGSKKKPRRRRCGCRRRGRARPRFVRFPKR